MPGPFPVPPREKRPGDEVGSILELTEVSCFLLKLTAGQVPVFDWIAGSTQVNSRKHKRGFIFRALSVARRGYTAILNINYSC